MVLRCFWVDLGSSGWFWGGSGVTLDGSEGGSVWICRDSVWSGMVLGLSRAGLEMVLGRSGGVLGWFWDGSEVTLGCSKLFYIVLGWFWDASRVVLGSSGVVLVWLWMVLCGSGWFWVVQRDFGVVLGWFCVILRGSGLILWSSGLFWWF
jgi:hypothetical protein